MWGLRFLNGPMAGQILPLKTGSNRLGRAPSCDVQVPLPGVSKEHLELMVAADKILLKDLQSANGTYLNGVRIKGGLVSAGDKISMHQILMEVIPYSGDKVLTLSRAPSRVPAAPPVPMPAHPAPVAGVPAAPPLQAASYPSSAYSENPVPPPRPPPQDLSSKVNGVWNRSHEFVENVALPGVYRLPQVFSFRQVIMGFIAVYIVMVTLLSVVPMKQITSESIQSESLRRALTVARALASANEKLIRSSDLSNFSTDMVLREDGISDVYVISKDGTILAPPERTGSAPREVGFARKIRGQPREFSEEISAGQIAAAVPILVFDPELQQNTAKAHAVVIYNPASLAFDDGRAFSLFVQMLFLAFIAGGVLFFFMYRLIEYPFKLLNSELDLALREGRDQAAIDFNFPVLQNTLTNINSLLARALAGSAAQQPNVAGKGARDQELFNLMQLMGYPCILIDRSEGIVRLNPAFEALTGISMDRLAGQRVTDIPDPAMQQNFQHLMNQSQMNMAQIMSDNLELGGHLFTLNCQAIANPSGDIEYFLITITPAQAAEGGAA